MFSASSLGTAPESIRAEDISELSPTGVAFTNTINGVKPVLTVELKEYTPELNAIYTRLAAARLGAIVRALGMCHIAGLHPVSTDRGFNSVISKIHGRAANTFQNALTAEGDPNCVRLALRVERILYEQLLPDEVLGAMSVDEVLRSRTKAWGEVGEKRAEFFRVVREMANEVADDAEFGSRVKNEIESYNKVNQKLADDWKRFGFKCGGWLLKGAGSTTAANVVEHAFGVGSWEVALIAAGFALKNIGPDAVSLWRTLSDAKSSAGRILVRPIEGLPIKAGGR